jgi:drug/metabolite transporter (DMT)-like permease
VLLGRERPGLHRLGALLAGFLSSIVLIATRSDAQFGHLSYWALAAFVSPLLYAFYNHYAAAGWPKGMDTLTAGVVESWASAFIALPVLLAVAMPTSAGDFHWGYWALVAATVMWVIERVAFFTMIRTAGPVTTVQASYVSTPASVCFGVLVFNEAADAFLWLSLGLLMLALWLNNRAMARAAAQ